MSSIIETFSPVFAKGFKNIKININAPTNITNESIISTWLCALFPIFFLSISL